MNHLVVTEAIRDLTSNQQIGEFTAKIFIEIFVKSLGISMKIPDLNFDSEGKIVGNRFWRDFNSDTMNIKVSIKSSKNRLEFKKVMETFERLIFETTRKRLNFFHIWRQISGFLRDLPAKCKNNIFDLFAAAISVKLIKKLAKANISENDDIMQSLSFSLKCVSRMSEKVHLTKETSERYTERVKILDEFFDFIQNDPIFFTEIFAKDTLNILEKGSMHADATTTMKSFGIIEAMLYWNNEEIQRTMFQHCTKRQNLDWLTSGVLYKYTKQEKVKGLEILYELLRFSQDNELHFERDWSVLFGTLYSPVHSIKQASKKLFLLDVRGSTENGTIYTLLERAINAYRLENDDSNINDIIEMFEEEEDFESCEKLFDILRIHSDKRGMCTVVILIINAAADRLARCDTKSEQLMILMKNVFRHVEFVKPYPHLLYRLINIIDFVKFKNDAELNEDFVSVKNTALDAFYECDQYNTAVGLLEVLRAIGFDTNKLIDIYDNLAHKRISNNSRQLGLLFLAADDTFNIFEKLHPNDKPVNYECFNNMFEASPDPEINALNLALTVNILSAYSSSTNIPDMPQNIIKEAADFFGKYLDLNILDPSNSLFTNMLLSTAYCVLHSKFTLTFEIKAFKEITYVLDTVSNDFKQRFNTDLRENDDKDFRLITKFWSKFTNLYEAEIYLPFNPDNLFENYLYADVHMEPYVEYFLITSLKYWSHVERYLFFALNVRKGVMYIKPANKVEPVVKKLFSLIKNSELSSEINAIAFKTFLQVMEYVRENHKRPKTVHVVLGYLYHNHLSPQNRELCLRNINHQITNCEGMERERLLKFLSSLQKPVEPELIDVESPPPPSRGTSIAPSNISNSTVTFRRSYSLAEINHSLLQ